MFRSDVPTLFSSGARRDGKQNDICGAKEPNGNQMQYARRRRCPVALVDCDGDCIALK
jgi:hypothetical protein